ncbi:response regulator [Paenibacillus cisolokensis]|uniref:response regulator transcription factor n=1 Tax=Paenibacillus cisolokensis TaxID=1658519 RepID=UPI003D28352F
MNSMYRILIVDDEPFIVNGLADLCERSEHLNLEIHKAYSASEALSWLKRTKMDIVLSDIKMPGMSGLALQKEIVKLWPHCKVIFLTGYDDFSYIQEAIREGSVDYILKTEGNDAVLKAIEKTMVLLNQKLAADSLIARARENLRMALPFLQQQYMLELLQRAPGRTRREELEQRFRELDMKLAADKPCLVLLCRIDSWSHLGGPAAQPLLLYAVQNITSELLAPMTVSMSVEYGRSKLIWMLQYKGDQSAHRLTRESEPIEDRVKRFVHGMLEQIQETCKSLLKLKTSFALAGEWTPWEHLSDKFEDLKYLMDSGLGIGHEVLLTETMTINRPESQRDIGRSRMHLKRMDLLRGCLENGDKEEFLKLFREVTDASCFPPEYEHMLKMEVYYGLVSVFMPSIVELESICQVVEGGETVDYIRLTHLEEHDSWTEAISYFTRLAEVIFGQKEQGKQDQQHEVIAKVKAYIEEHLAGDLSLTQIGEAVGHNPSYLSRLYKQVTGEGLSESINAARLAKAKRLLAETSEKIHVIAAAVGFSSPPYFYRFFKKTTHLTPQEYRELQNR